MKYLVSLLIILFSVNVWSVEKFPVEHFFKNSAMSSPALSPDGQHLAALTPLNIAKETVAQCKNKNRRKKSRSGVVDFCDVSRRNIVVFDLGDSNANCQKGIISECKRVRVTQLSQQDVSGFEWVNNDRIMFQTGGDQLNTNGAIDTVGIYAVNKDGTQPKQLVKPEDALTNSKVIQTRLLSLLPFDPEHILVMRNDRMKTL